MLKRKHPSARHPRTLIAAMALLGLLVPSSGHAFCGFYVSGADASLYNNATVTVLMRDGTRTVMSMQNNYEGPPQDFAMVVPVPVVLQKENVKTLNKEAFTRVDQLSAPRLAEYWEQDPCYVEPPMRAKMMRSMAAGAPMMESAVADDLGVKIEAKFVVGEYQIVILSASDSGGLETWLHQQKYKIPKGAAKVLQPYVASGTKFFVAKVDVEKVRFEDGKAMLSPLRFHFEDDNFALPVRLGLLNSKGTQDLLVHILARNQRYEVANYKNVTVPTNLVVNDAVREDFGAFYASLFDRVIEHNPNAVVTEYAWNASGCDPCPTPALTPAELMTLGLDTVGSGPWGFVLTRLHYRYDADSLDEDLVFRPAPAIVGGRGMPNIEGQLPPGIEYGGSDAFQGRYIILHEWEGPIECEAPRRGRWGGPPNQPPPVIKPAMNLAFVKRDMPLNQMVRTAVPTLEIMPGAQEPPKPEKKAPKSTHPKAAVGGSGCASCSAAGGPEQPTGFILAWAAVAFVLLRRRLV